MGNGLYVDIFRLEEHSSKILQELRVAQLLSEQLRLVRRYADPIDISHYDELINQAEKLERYFQLMAETVEGISMELRLYSMEIGMMLNGKE